MKSMIAVKALISSQRVYLHMAIIISVLSAVFSLSSICSAYQNEYLNNQFNPTLIKPKSIHFYIDPRGAKDSTNVQIPSENIIAAFRAACNQWNTMRAYTGITLSVSDTTISGKQIRDHINCVSFCFRDIFHIGEAFPYFDENNNLTEADIEFASNTDWYASTGTSPRSIEWDFWGCALHEIGHIMGLGHVERKYYENFIMEPHCNGIGLIGPRYLASGDMAGILYTSGYIPSGNIPCSISFPRDSSVNLSENIYVPSGDTLEIRSNTTINFGPYKIESTGGYIDLHNISQNYIAIMKSGTTDIKGLYSSISAAVFSLSPGDAVYFPNGYTVKNGETLNVPTNCSLKIGAKKNISVSSGGTLSIASGVVLNNVPEQTEWSGIYINDGGTLKIYGGMTIKNAEVAFSIFSNDVTFPNITCHVDSCSTNAVICDKSPIIKYLRITNTSMKKNRSAVWITGVNSNPSIYNFTIMHSYRGIQVNYTSDAIIKYCVLDSIQEACINLAYIKNGKFITSAGIDMAWGQSDIIPSSGKKAIANVGSLENTWAQNIWWGTAAPDPAGIFSKPGDVNVIPYATSNFKKGAPELTIPTVEPFDETMVRTKIGDANEVLNNYYDIITTSKSIITKRMAIKSIFQVNEKKKINFAKLRETIQNELANAQTYYKFTLEYILCDMLVSEGRYQEAIDSFSQLADVYPGTPMEVELLSRIAYIYGTFMEKKDIAKKYADKAAGINQGQDILRTAYYAAGIEYHPWEFEDKFISIQPEPGEPTPDSSNSITNEEFVSVSPNPANQATTISYSIKSPSSVKLNIYSINGQKVATLVDGPVSAGVHAVRFNGSHYASGVYFYRFESTGLNKTGKLLLLK